MDRSIQQLHDQHHHQQPQQSLQHQQLQKQQCHGDDGTISPTGGEKTEEMQINVQYLSLDNAQSADAESKPQQILYAEAVINENMPKMSHISPTLHNASPIVKAEPQPFCFLATNINQENVSKASFLNPSSPNMVPMNVKVGGSDGSYHRILPPSFRVDNKFIQSGVEYNILSKERHNGQTFIRPPLIFSNEEDAKGSLYAEKSLEESGYSSRDVKNWDNILQPPKDSLYKLLRHMIDTHIKPNVQVSVGDVIFNCHMMVLQCYSDFFMECNNELAISLPKDQLTASAFVMVYDWMLADEPVIQRDGILELFNAAHFLRIPNLINQCWLCLDDDERFREDSAFMLYLEARSYHLLTLEDLMLNRICKFFLTLVSTRDYLMLEARDLCTLLSSNAVGVNSETEIFMAAIRWLSFDWEKREQYMVDVAKCIRYSLLPPWFLISLTKSTDSAEVNHMVKHPEISRLISDGISFNTAQLFYGVHRQEYLTFLERYDLMTPSQRRWLYDKNCSYHVMGHGSSMGYVTYEAFLEYLTFLQDQDPVYWHSMEMQPESENDMFQPVHTMHEGGEPHATSRKR